MPTTAEAFQSYYSSDPVADDIGLQKAPPTMWEAKGRELALKGFQTAATRVPAYKDFLKKHGVDPTTVTTYEAFQQVPVTDKETYLMQYPLDQLCLDGNLAQTNIISSSSGSSGKPLYWPRMLEADVNVAKVLELLFRANFAIDKTPTLMLMSFGLGVWTAGIYMLTSSRFVAEKGYPLTITSPGIDLDETVKVLKNVAPFYQQVMLVGFPGFVKDVVDRALAEGVDLAKLNFKVFTSGEVHTEPWRDYIIKKTGMKNEFTDVTSVLASSEGGLIGMETALSVYLRRLCFHQPKMHEAFFGQESLPSIVQYNPISRFYEVENGELVLTSPGSLPLIRFNTHDRGGLLRLDEILAKLAAEGVDEKQVQTTIGSAPWSLPFVYVYGRNLTATIYAVNVYPESIKTILLDPELEGKITGRFAMRNNEDAENNQYLEFFVELSSGQKESVIDPVYLETFITDHLKQVNSEFRKLSESIERKLVTVRLRPFHDKEYFAAQKQKFVITKPHA